MICITFDTDYMTDKWMEEFLEKYPFAGSGTFFAHKNFDINWKNHEVGIHPFLSDSTTWGAVVDKLAAEVKSPRAVNGVRAHSCVYSQMFGIDLAKKKYKYISQSSPLFSTSIEAYRHPWGVWELPIYYMDNMDFCFPINWPELNHQPFNKEIIDDVFKHPDKLFVFDFHPLHIMLNTSVHGNYSKIKNKIMEQNTSPSQMAFSGSGTRDFFNYLCEKMVLHSVKSLTCTQVVERYETNA